MNIPGIGQIGICPVHILKDNYNLLQNGQFNILDYGADANGAISASAAIQQAVDDAADWSSGHLGLGATVRIPAGYYYITAGIELRSYVHIICDPGAMFRFAAAYAGNMWQVSVGNSCVFASVAGGVYGQQGGTRTWNLISIESDDGGTAFTMFIKFLDMNCFDCNIGINFDVKNDGWINGCIFDNIVLWRPVKGSQFRQEVTGSGIDGNMLSNIAIQMAAGVTTHGFDWVGARAVSHNKANNIAFWDLQAGQLAIATNGNYNSFTNLLLTDPNTYVSDTGTRNLIYDYRGGFHSPIEVPFRYHGLYADRADANKVIIDHAGDAGTSAAPAGDVGIKLKSYQSTAYGAISDNSAARIITRNQAGTDFGSWLILQTHAPGSGATYLSALILKPSGGTRLLLAGCPVYANNAAAIAGGLVAGDLYRTGGDPDSVCIVH